MVDEGRRILRNVQRVAKLFVTKSAFAAFLILSVGLTPTAYPLLPRHLTLAATLTIGIPGFFLALGPTSGPLQSRGASCATSALRHPCRNRGRPRRRSPATCSRSTSSALDLSDARTVATTALVLVGLYLILALEATGAVRGTAIVVLTAALLATYLAILILPGPRSFFALSPPHISILLPAILGAALAAGGLSVVDDRFIPFVRAS